MPKDSLSHVATWIFDLDNTLYPPEMGLFDQIEWRMTQWVSSRLKLDRAAADHLRKDYWSRYGTTLAGLMAEHGVDPHDYLYDVHDVDFSPVQRDLHLARLVAELPGRRIVFTNADTLYASRVLERRGLSGLFDAVYGVEDAGFHPKPERESYLRIFAADGLDPKSAAFFEDDPRNLKEPHAMGVATIHVAPEPSPADHVQHHTDDLSGFLGRILR